MYHIYQRCLSRTAPHLMLPCNPQMSGAGSGPSAVTMKKWSKSKRQGWQKKENLRKQRAATARAADGTDPARAAHNPGAPHSDTALGCCQLTLPYLRFAATSPRTPATKQTRRNSPDSPSSPNPSQTKRREHGDIAPVPGVEEEKPTGASGNQATTLVAADCTGANADGRGGPMQTPSGGLASLSTADRAAPATTKVHSAIVAHLGANKCILVAQQRRTSAHLLRSRGECALIAQQEREGANKCALIAH